MWALNNIQSQEEKSWTDCADMPAWQGRHIYLMPKMSFFMVPVSRVEGSVNGYSKTSNVPIAGLSLRTRTVVLVRYSHGLGIV